jgi:8-oxo-dGTP pyrophosphatase MutT (NUDIX family)
MTLNLRLQRALELGLARDTDLIHHDGTMVDLAAAPVPAAVLIAVTDRADPGVILTQRPSTMRRHAGQVAFPGGRIDASDADAVAAALREAEEETALSPHHVIVIGATDQYRTVTGYEITPILGVIPPDLALIANPDEVEHIFEVPLAFLLNPANHARRAIDWNGATRHYYEMTWGGHRIWGATASMIVNLSRRLAWTH